MVEDFEGCYRAVMGRDARFDGWFVTAVVTTGIYCRPSCPARTPMPAHVRFYPGAAAAQQAGFRACKRCRPDASPGSPEWNSRQDIVARAMRLIREGMVDRDGVGGLARHLGYSPRQLTRVVSDALGAGPLALARAQRAQTARTLIETAALPMSEVAFASGFASVRQFNDTIRQVFACTPTVLRRRALGSASTFRSRDALVLRLAHRHPYDAAPTFQFLAQRAVPGVEAGNADRFARTLTLTHGTGVVELAPASDHVRARLWLDDLRDVAPAVQRCRSLLDLDADPVAVADHLGADPVLGPQARRHPGMRMAGCVDPHELAIRAVVGQQVSLAAARRVLTRLTAEHGTTLVHPHAVAGGDLLAHRFPTMDVLAALDPARLPMPRARGRTLVSLADALATGALGLDAGADADAARHAMRAVDGVGTWTADYVAMRGLGHPDILLSSDLGVRRAAARVHEASTATAIDAVGQAWRPWRSYATFLLWNSGGAVLPRAS